MSKFEIKRLSRYTELIPNARGDGVSQSIYTVEYVVRINKKLTMTKELTLWATDELDAYNKARHEITNNVRNEDKNVIRNGR